MFMEIGNIDCQLLVVLEVDWVLKKLVFKVQQNVLSCVPFILIKTLFLVHKQHSWMESF
jgi:hypothetical protein